jgi:hypothetical protein
MHPNRLAELNIFIFTSSGLARSELERCGLLASGHVVVKIVTSCPAEVRARLMAVLDMGGPPVTRFSVGIT